MPVDLHLRPDAVDLAVSAHEDARALDAHVGLAVHALLRPHAGRFDQRALGIGEEWNLEAVFVAELAVLFDGIGGHAEDGTPLAANSSARAVKSRASSVQPDVSSFG